MMGGETVKIDRNKLELELARACMSRSSLAMTSGVSAGTLQSAFSGENIRPDKLGKIARALGVSPETIVKMDGADK